MYQVGLMETDRHVQYFWTALESFSQVCMLILSPWLGWRWDTLSVCVAFYNTHTPLREA